MEPTSQQPASTEPEEAQQKPVDTTIEPATDLPSMASESNSSAVSSSEEPNEPLLSTPTIKPAMDGTANNESSDMAQSENAEATANTEELSMEDLKPASPMEPPKNDATSSLISEPSSPSEAEEAPLMTSEDVSSASSSVEDSSLSSAPSDMSSYNGDLINPGSSIDTMPVPTAATPSPMTSDMHKKSPMLMWLVFIVALIIVAAVAALAAYRWGHNRGYTSGKAAGQAAMMQQSEASAIAVPSSATIVSSCTPGEGIQYAIPKDLPGGPFYNVWQNKVVGMEYMVGQTTLSKNPINNLQTHGVSVNHIDVMYEAAGHAGFSEPHYHINLSMLSYADEAKITCGASSGSSNMMH